MSKSLFQFPSSMDEHLPILDNLGDGNCAVYAFILGGLHLAKNYHNMSFIKRWKIRDPSVSDLLDQVLGGGIDDSLSFNREVMSVLNRSMRHILIPIWLKAIPNEAKKQSFTYFRDSRELSHAFNEFSGLCQFVRYEQNPGQTRLADFNLHAMHSNILYAYGYRRREVWILEMTQKVVAVYQDQTKAPTLSFEQKQHIWDKLVYASMLEYRAEITEFYRHNLLINSWLSDTHLNQLAEIFDTPLVLNRKFSICYHPGKPFIHVINRYNAHWLTELYQADYQYPFKAQDLERKFSEAIDGYLKLDNQKRFIQYGQQCAQYLEHHFSDIGVHFQRIDDALKSAMTKLGIPDIAVFFEQNPDMTPQLFIERLMVCTPEQKQAFLANLEFDKTLGSISRCIEAMLAWNRAPFDEKLKNEFLIEQNRLFQDIDPMNMEYQEELQAFLEQRRRADDAEIDEISSLRDALRKTTVPSIVFERPTLNSRFLISSFDTKTSFAQTRSRTDSFDRSSDDESEESTSNDSFSDDGDDYKFSEDYAYYPVLGTLGGAFIGVVLGIGLCVFASYTAPVVFAMIVMSALVGALSGFGIKTYCDSVKQFQMDF